MSEPALLVLRALGLGDFLTGVPAYRAIARAFPAHRRILAAPRALHDLVPLLGATFAGACDVAPLGPIPPQWRGTDVAINLHGRGPQSHRTLLALAPLHLIAFGIALPDIRVAGPAWRDDEHDTARWCRLLEACAIGADPRELSIDVPNVDGPPLPGTTVIHPGAASEARRWPSRRWSAVARACAAAGDRVVVTGSRAECELAARVVADAGLGPHANLAGTTSLRELAALVAHANRVVCGDTGIAHLASAYGTPSVVLFGPVAPALWGPPGLSRHRTLWNGRLGDPHAGRVDPGLLEIQPRAVMAEIGRLRSLDGTPDREEGRSTVTRDAATSSSARTHIRSWT